MNGELTEAGEAAVLLLHLPDAVEAEGDNGQAEVLGEEANAGLERDHTGGVAIVDHPLGEDEKAVATIGGFAGEAETLAETRELRKREDVEERNDEKVVELPEPALGEEPFAGRMAKLAQGFPAHGGGEAMAEARRKRIEDEANISAAGGVIGDEQHRTFQIGEVLAAADARVAEQEGGRPSESVINEMAQKAHRGALRPARIDIVRASGGGLREKVLNIGEGLRVGELRFVEFDVVAVLESGEKFDAVERGKIFE